MTLPAHEERDVTIERVRSSDAEAVSAFLSAAYRYMPLGAPFRDPVLALRRWRWLNEEYPIPLPGGPPAWVCRADGRMVGHVGVLAATAVVHSRAIPMAWARDLVVDASMRGRGIGSRLMTMAMRETGRTMILGSYDEVLPLYRRLGYRDLGRVPVHVRVVSPSRFPLVVRLPAAAVGLIGSAIDAARGPAARRRLRAIRTEAIERYDERFDRWWADVERAVACVIRRTSATMNWRYVRHPHHRYASLGAFRGADLQGVVVLRRAAARGVSAVIVAELLAPPRDPDVAAALLSAAHRWARSGPEPAGLVRCVLLHGTLERQLRRAGYVRAPSPVHWGIAVTDGDPAEIGRREEWMLNGGDSDLDLL